MTVPAGTFTVSPWIRLVRPRQWAKNGVVFAAPLGAGVFIFEPAPFYPSVGPVAFGGAAAGTQVLNDVADLDRNPDHPTSEPVAAGEVPVLFALLVAATLVLGLPRTTSGLHRQVARPRPGPTSSPVFRRCNSACPSNCLRVDQHYSRVRLRGLATELINTDVTLTAVHPSQTLTKNDHRNPTLPIGGEPRAGGPGDRTGGSGAA